MRATSRPSTLPSPGTFVAALAAAVVASCAQAGPPKTFRFASNRDSAAAVQCARNRLRIEGFVLADSLASPTVALRRVESRSEVGADEWWRVDVSIGRDEEGRTVVETLAGVSGSPGGPFREPHVELQGVVGKISASCTW